MQKPFSESCEQNREPILQVIEPLLRDASSLLEIGSGTGQHAVYFGAHLPHLRWQASDCADYLPGIRLWIDEAALSNVPVPLELDVTLAWPVLSIDAVFSANSVHIMHWHMVEALFAGVGRVLPSGGMFLLYGPFNYQGSYSSESNARFDAWLKARDPGSGIRDIEKLVPLAENAGLILRDDFSMPANNRILYWQRS
ncbi:MAG: DUF938 domain-containing protein [Gammaproteobacteria bacterium]